MIEKEILYITLNKVPGTALENKVQHYKKHRALPEKKKKKKNFLNSVSSLFSHSSYLCHISPTQAVISSGVSAPTLNI